MTSSATRSAERVRGRQGFSLVELIVAIAILILVLTGLFRLFLYCSALAEMSGNMTRAVAAAQNKMEEMREHTFSSIVTDYGVSGIPGNTFTLVEPTGKGAISIDATNPALLEVTVRVSYRNQNGRIIGEDADLNGVFDVSTEDANGNGVYDAPVTLVTLMSSY